MADCLFFDQLWKMERNGSIMIWKAKKFLFIRNIGNHLSVQPAIQFEWIDLSFLQLPTRTLSAERNPLQIFYNIFCKKKTFSWLCFTTWGNRLAKIMATKTLISCQFPRLIPFLYGQFFSGWQSVPPRFTTNNFRVDFWHFVFHKQSSWAIIVLVVV